MKKDFDYSKTREISVEIDGKKFTGSYILSGGVVTVSTPHGLRSAQLGGMTPEGLARILLRETVSNSKEG